MADRAWNIDSRHSNFESADLRRKDLLSKGKDTQAKVRRTAAGIFTVRTRKSDEASGKRDDRKKKSRKNVQK